MVRRVLIVAAAVAGLVLSTSHADATCRPGRVQVLPKPSVELPHCDPYPQ